MTGSEEQRTQIRALLRKMTGTRDSMGIPFTEIRHKIDAARFRLALIYESMKDLAEDTRDARTTIEELCRAARLAGIDPDPPLREVAAVSSEIDHHGMGSMKALLLERMTGGGARISCRVCGNSHESILAGCPICASRGMSWQSGAATRSRENQQDVLEQGVGEDESLIYLPTRQLLGFTILGLAAIYFLWATAIDIFRLVWGDELNPNWYYPKLVVQIAAFLLLWVFRFDRMIRKYSTKRRELRLGVTWKQSVLLVVLFWAILGVTVWLLATFGQRLGL
jgi:rubrerythrin